MALTQVSTEGIKNLTIKDEDISNSAAINASKVSGLSTDSVIEGNSKAEVIGSGTDDGEFKVTLQDATYTGAGKTSLHQYTDGSYNITELNPNAGNIAANSSLILNHLTASNAWSTIDFKKSGASTGSSQIRCMAGTAFQFFPQDGNYMLQLNNSYSTFGNIVQPSADSTHDLGQNTNRWRNVYADDYYGSGANLTSIPAGQLTGTVADARISTLTASKLTGALPAIDGSNLTGVAAGGANNISFNSGNGIDFSATGDGSNVSNESELLNDYEKGTWTGSIQTGSANIHSEWYVKIGNLVMGGGGISAISDTSSGNAIKVNGLPFSANNTGYGAVGGSKNTAFSQMCVTQVSGSSVYLMKSSTSTGSWNYILHSDQVQSTGGIVFSFQYFVS